MTDSRLQDLKRAWEQHAATDEGTVAYLAELLRAGLVTHNECVLAWRLHRVETVVASGTAAAAPILMTGSWEDSGRFNPDVPIMCRAVLYVLLGTDPVIGASSYQQQLGDDPNPLLAGPLGGAFTAALGGPRPSQASPQGPTVTQLAERVTVMGQALARFEPGGPVPCSQGYHWGPIDYDTGARPQCERCRQHV